MSAIHGTWARYKIKNGQNKGAENQQAYLRLQGCQSFWFIQHHRRHRNVPAPISFWTNFQRSKGLRVQCFYAWQPQPLAVLGTRKFLWVIQCRVLARKAQCQSPQRFWILGGPYEHVGWIPLPVSQHAHLQARHIPSPDERLSAPECLYSLLLGLLTKICIPHRIFIVIYVWSIVFLF